MGFLSLPFVGLSFLIPILVVIVFIIIAFGAIGTLIVVWISVAENNKKKKIQEDLANANLASDMELKRKCVEKGGAWAGGACKDSKGNNVTLGFRGYKRY